MLRKGEEIDALSRILQKKAKPVKQNTPAETPEAQQQNEGQTSGVAKLIWNCLTPNTKRSTAIKMKNISPSSRSTRAIRNEIGLNLSKQFSPPDKDGSQLCQDVKKFFDRDDITSLCPDKKKAVKNPLDEDEEPTQIRYRNSNIQCLLAKFNAERLGPSCEERIFQKYIPFYVKKANPLEWGTCMCEYCLNPELKYASLRSMKVISGEEFEERVKNEKKFPS